MRVEGFHNSPAQYLLRLLRSAFLRLALPYPELLKMVRHFDSETMYPDVLVLGDSVLERVSRFDRDKRSLGRILGEKMRGRYRYLCISHSAYHMKIYHALLSLLDVTRRKPRLVVLPINIRSFSPQWDLEPSWQFDREIKLIDEYISSHKKHIPVINKLSSGSFDYERFDATTVKYPLTAFDTIGQFRLVINGKPRTEEQFRFRKKQIFIFHYLHKLSVAHPKIKALTQLVKKISAWDVRLLIYITPVNSQAGDRYVGDQFSELFKANIQVIHKILNPYLSSKMKLLDLSSVLPPDDFFNPGDPTEHLNENGRLFLASKLFETISAMMN